MKIEYKKGLYNLGFIVGIATALVLAAIIIGIAFAFINAPSYVQGSPEVIKEAEARMPIFTRLVQIIFTPRYFEPHRVHFYGDGDLLWWLVFGNALIALSYVLIPIGIIYFLRKKKDMVFINIFWLYGSFIVLCGMTHVMMIMVFWYPVYWLEAAVLWVTGLVSIATFFSMIRIMPLAIQLKSPKELEAINARLAIEVESRRQAEGKLKENEKVIAAKNEILMRALESSDSQKEELMKMNKFMIDREMKMVEMKKEIENMKQKNAPQRGE